MANKVANDGKNYAYIDKGGSLHVADNRVSGEKNSANGKILEVAMPCSGGYPLVGGAEVEFDAQDYAKYEKYLDLAVLYRKLK